MDFIPFQPDPNADPDLIVFRRVHLCGGPLDGEIRRFQILPFLQRRQTGEYHIKKNGALHCYRTRDPNQASSHDTWADYIPSPLDQ
jgi:hypothetical protein